VAEARGAVVAAARGTEADVVGVAGVPLATYAAVMAALAEPFPLEQVLAAQKLEPDAWAEADLGWTERLVEDAALLARYEAELVAAQDRMARAVEPLDADLSAWVAFLGALAAAPSAGEVLALHGLGENDLARLRRGWDKRMKEDPTLEKRAAELRQRGGGRVPRVRVAPAVLPHAPATRAEPSAKLGPAFIPALQQPPETPPEKQDALDAARLRDHRKFVTRPGLGPVIPPLPPLPTLTTPKQPAAKVASPRASRFEGPPPEALPRLRFDDEPTRTKLVVDAVARPLPFRATPSRAYMEALEAAGAEPGDGSDGATARIDPANLAPLAPDAMAVAMQAAPLVTVVPIAPVVTAPLVTDEASIDVLLIDDPTTVTSMVAGASSDPLPFAPDLPDATYAPWRTVRMSATPRREETDAPTRLMPSKGLRVAAPRDIEDPETVAGAVESTAKPLPFIAYEDDDEQEERASPFSTIEVHGEMSVERHASLCVELALDPEGAGEILARYHVTPEEKERADLVFKDLFASDPALRAAWNRAFEIYRTWLLGRR
jgi:hypothetical protein